MHRRWRWPRGGWEVSDGLRRCFINKQREQHDWLRKTYSKTFCRDFIHLFIIIIIIHFLLFVWWIRCNACSLHDAPCSYITRYYKQYIIVTTITRDYLFLFIFLFVLFAVSRTYCARDSRVPREKRLWQFNRKSSYDALNPYDNVLIFGGGCTCSAGASIRITIFELMTPKI